MKKLALRRDDACHVCRVSLTAGVYAWWDPTARTVTCLQCGEHTGLITGDPFAGPGLATSVAGASAREEHRRRTDARNREFEAAPLGGVRRALAAEPQSTAAWSKGAAGEERLGQILEQVANVIVLHDRLVPGTKANIDHIVVAANGVWIVDAKNYKGKIERRRGKKGIEVWVNGRNRTKLVAGMGKQRLAVAPLVRGLAPVHTSLCFLGVQWPFLLSAFSIGNVTIDRPSTLRTRLSGPGQLTGSQLRGIAAQLDAALRPAAGRPERARRHQRRGAGTSSTTVPQPPPLPAAARVRQTT